MRAVNDFQDVSARLREWIGRPKASCDNQRFGELALDLFALQFEHNEPYRRLCQASGLHPGTVAHWGQIPAVPTSAFKELDLSCLPPEQRTAAFHSSGTTGQRPSRHFH